MKTYDPRNWYWFVAGDETRVYSSAGGDYVPVSNPAYVAWASDGTQPTRIDTEGNLGAVLADPRVRPTHSGVLAGYLDTQAGDVVDLIQFKVLFNHENRLRAVERALNLNSSPANLTPAQARQAVKVLL